MPSFRRYYCPKNIFFSLFLGLFSISSAAAEPPGSGARAFAQLSRRYPHQMFIAPHLARQAFVIGSSRQIIRSM